MNPAVRRVVFFAGAPLLLGGLEAAQLFVRAASGEAPMPWADALLLTLPRWLLLGALAPGVEIVTTRFPLSRESLARALAAHVPAGVLFAVLHLAGCVVVYGFLIEGIPNRFPFRFSRLLTVYLAGDLLIYGALVAVFSALRLAGESRERTLAASRLEAELRDAQLDTLRAQLNPHFIFNVLNAASVLARKGDGEGVLRMLGALSELLRTSLDPSLRREVALSSEMALLERYIEIQSARFADRLTVHRSVSPETLDALVPSMVLQPLVENAIRHGVGTRPGPGTVTVRARREGGSLRLEVEDDGPGFGAGSSGRGDGMGIGLANTRARLAHLYGEAHRFEAGNLASGGAVVALTIPWRSAALAGASSASTASGGAS